LIAFSGDSTHLFEEIVHHHDHGSAQGVSTQKVEPLLKYFEMEPHFQDLSIWTISTPLRHYFTRPTSLLAFLKSRNVLASCVVGTPDQMASYETNG
jgi:hypothetical protein